MWQTSTHLPQTVFLRARADNISVPGAAYGTSDPNLRNVRRTFQTVSPTQGILTTQYRYINADMQSLVVVQPESSVTQITTFEDRDGNEVTVTHDSTTQRPEVSSLRPTSGYTFDVMMRATSAPLSLLSQIVGHLHTGDPWNDTTTGTALCTAGTYTPLSTDPSGPQQATCGTPH